jgi:predicted metal-dependent hydrolase
MNKILKLIAPKHYIIVDDAKFYQGDFIYLEKGNTPSTKEGEIVKCEFPDANGSGVAWRRVTHSTKPLEQYYNSAGGSIPYVFDRVKKLNLSYVEEAIYGHSVEKMAKKYLGWREDLDIDEEERYYLSDIGKYDAFIEGYNAHEKISRDKLFIVEKAIQVLEEEKFGQGGVSRDEYKSRVISKLQSLLPKKEWIVEVDDIGRVRLINEIK